MNRGPTHKPLVAVIGGGISGLSVAFWLLHNQIDTMVFEETDRPGGVIRSVEADGYLIDYAANCLLNYLPEVNVLCDVIGVREDQTYRSESARKRYLLKNGHPNQLPQGLMEFVRTNLWSLRGKLRLLSEPLIPRVKSVQEETISQFITRRFGPETLEQVVEPFIGGSYAGNPSQLCAKSIFPVLHALEQRYGSLMIGALIRRLRGSRANCPMHLFSFHHGMETLPRAISLYLRDRFMPRSRVIGIGQRRDKTWNITVEQDGRSQIYPADGVVIATRSMEASTLLRSIDAPVSEMLKKVEYSPVAIVYTGFKREAVKHPLDGIGCMIPSREGYHILGTLWNSTLFAKRAPDGMVALTNYLGGRRDPEIVDQTDEELINRTITDLDKIVGLMDNPTIVRIIRHRSGLPQYSLGHQSLLRTVEGLPDRILGLSITGNYLRGISVRDCISYGAKLAKRMAEQYI